MIFYKLEGMVETINGQKLPERFTNKDASLEYSSTMLLKTESFNNENRALGLIFLSSITSTVVTVGIITYSIIDIKDSRDDDTVTCNALLQALWANNRLSTRRYLPEIQELPRLQLQGFLFGS